MQGASAPDSDFLSPCEEVSFCMAVKVDKETIICALTATDKRGKEARNEIQLGYGLQQHLLPERDIGKVCRDFLLDVPLSQSRFLIVAYRALNRVDMMCKQE